VWDYAVQYASARSTERYKVFKGATVHLKPEKSHALVFRRDFVPRTTRKLYSGSHAIEIIVNGTMAGRATFELHG
jgi:hypothetical protein